MSEVLEGEGRLVHSESHNSGLVAASPIMSPRRCDRSRYFRWVMHLYLGVRINWLVCISHSDNIRNWKWDRAREYVKQLDDVLSREIYNRRLVDSLLMNNNNCLSWDVSYLDIGWSERTSIHNRNDARGYVQSVSRSRSEGIVGTLRVSPGEKYQTPERHKLHLLITIFIRKYINCYSRTLIWKRVNVITISDCFIHQT